MNDAVTMHLKQLVTHGTENSMENSITRVSTTVAEQVQSRYSETCTHAHIPRADYTIHRQL